MACISRGALCAEDPEREKRENDFLGRKSRGEREDGESSHPVRDCRPAPMVERRAPIRMTQGEGQASRATVRPLADPYWSLRRNVWMVAPKNSTHDRSRDTRSRNGTLQLD